MTSKVGALSDKIVDELEFTIKDLGATWTQEAQFRAVQELHRHPEQAALQALRRCRLEFTGGRFLLAHIIERIDDGRPGADEVWSVVGHSDEERSFVTTNEALEAWGRIRDLIDTDDIGARMAFREAYGHIVAENRAKGVPVQWIPTLGKDPAGRDAALRTAAERKQLGSVHAGVVAGVFSNQDKDRARLESARVRSLPHAEVPLLSAPTGSVTSKKAEARAMFGSILASMGDPGAMRKMTEDLEAKLADEQRRRDSRARAAGG